MPKQYKNLIVSLTYTEYTDLLDLFTKLTNKVGKGVEEGTIHNKSASGDFLVKFPEEHGYKDRIINGQHCRVYKSKL